MADGFEITRVSTIEKTHKMVRRAETDEYGPFKIFKHHATDELVLVKEKTTNSKVELTHEISSVERRYNFRHPNLLDMVDWSVEKKSQMCATFYKIKTFFKFHPTTLNMLISKRRKEGNMLDDTEMMQLTYDGVDALGYLQSQNISHGFLRPELIAVEKNGQFVICDKLLEGTSRDAHLFAYRTKKDIYSSPSVWDEMVNDRRSRHNGYKDDAFSYGLTLLYAANMVPPQDIYERNGRVNEGNLERQITQASAKYNNVPLYGQILRKLLAINEKDRWDFLTLMSSMPTRQQIQYYFTNYNNDSYFEDPQFIESSRINASQVMNEYNKMAQGEQIKGQRGLGMDPLTSKILNDEHSTRYNLAGTQGPKILNGSGLSDTRGRFSKTAGGFSSHNENPNTRKNIMRERVKAPRQFNVPRPGKIDYSVVGDQYVNAKPNQTLGGMSAIPGMRETVNFTNGNSTMMRDPDNVAYDFDGQKNKHAVPTEDAMSMPPTPPGGMMGNIGHNQGLVFSNPNAPLQPVHPNNMMQGQMGGPGYGQQPKKQSLKTFLDNFTNQPESQRVSQNTQAPMMNAPPPPLQPGYSQGMPMMGQGQNPVLQKTAPPISLNSGPQYRSHGRGGPRQVASRPPITQNQGFRAPPQPYNPQISAGGNIGYGGYGAGGRAQVHNAGQERGFVDPTQLGR